MTTPTIRTALAEVVELIPRKVRTALYVAAVVVGALALAAQRLVPIWVPELDARVDATVADVTAGALFLLGALGTAYRPTRTDQALSPVEDAYEAVYAQEAQARAVATLKGAGFGHAEAVDAVQSGDLRRLTGAQDDA
ncbi:hypothetical protein [Promicromonospora sp. NPDC050880]|uniref:hypothetical protein n=1 Tax=Promicromonospora sp. NPDC050880 TaxID=3364406 RepID=UPI0037A45C20